MRKPIVLIFAILIAISFISCTKESTSKIPIEETVSQDSTIVNTRIKDTEEFIVLLEKLCYKTKSTKENITNSIYEFKSTPHFYKNENVIVSYFGDNKETIEILENSWDNNLQA